MIIFNITFYTELIRVESEKIIPQSKMAEIDMKEGFLCPICKIDLKTMTKLHSHFHEEHSEDIDIKKIFKGIIYNIFVNVLYLPLKY